MGEYFTLDFEGLLADKTRLWALNSLSFLRYCDRIVVMNGFKYKYYLIKMLMKMVKSMELAHWNN